MLVWQAVTTAHPQPRKRQGHNALHNVPRHTVAAAGRPPMADGHHPCCTTPLDSLSPNNPGCPSVLTVAPHDCSFAEDFKAATRPSLPSAGRQQLLAQKGAPTEKDRQASAGRQAARAWPRSPRAPAKARCILLVLGLGPGVGWCGVGGCLGVA